jgi:Putative transposase/Transposase zinc-binding domain
MLRPCPGTIVKSSMLLSLVAPRLAGLRSISARAVLSRNSSSFPVGNRHCSTYQYSKSQQWLQTQIQRQLPGHHFLITFTVPEHLRSFIRQHQRFGYSALFKSSSAAIKKLATDPKHIGADLPGFFGVLHTWGRTLQYHPHIHYTFRVALFVHWMALGILPESISFCRSKRSRSSFLPSSTI